jgi:hypothetical protein
MALDEYTVLTPGWHEAYAEWRKTHPPIMGGSPEGDEGSDGDNAGSTETTESTSGNEGRDGADNQEDANEEDESSPAEAQLVVLKAELQRLKRENAEQAKKQRKADAEARARDEKRREEQGQYKELAGERAKEIEALKAQIAERDKRDAERAQRTKVTAIAEKLNYRDPNLAFPILLDTLGPEEAADTLEDDTLIEAALKRLARDREYLVDKQRRSGAPVGRNGQSGKPDPNKDLAATILALTGGSQ